jgi:hypothetical protein
MALRSSNGSAALPSSCATTTVRHDRSRVGLINVLGSQPQPARRSITFDGGIEFTDWTYVQAELGARTWFCDPQGALAERYHRKHQSMSTMLVVTEYRSVVVQQPGSSPNLRPP